MFKRITGLPVIPVPGNNLVLETGILWFHPRLLIWETQNPEAHSLKKVHFDLCFNLCFYPHLMNIKAHSVLIYILIYISIYVLYSRKRTPNEKVTFSF